MLVIVVVVRVLGKGRGEGRVTAFVISEKERGCVRVCDCEDAREKKNKCTYGPRGKDTYSW